jgi:hypothetical protein
MELAGYQLQVPRPLTGQVATDRPFRPQTCVNERLDVPAELLLLVLRYAAQIASPAVWALALGDVVQQPYPVHDARASFDIDTFTGSRSAQVVREQDVKRGPAGHRP